MVPSRLPLIANELEAAIRSNKESGFGEADIRYWLWELRAAIAYGNAPEPKKPVCPHCESMLDFDDYCAHCGKTLEVAA